MKHIETTCPEETKARKEYSVVVEGEPVVADDQLEATVRELLVLRRKMDDDALKASQLKAVIMNAMKNRDTLKGKSGDVLVSWSAGGSKKSVDYQGLFKMYNVTYDDIAKFTTFKTGSRIFSIEID